MIQACKIGFHSNFGLVNLKGLSFFLRKYISGITPPINWLIPVATAAPNTPILKTYINKKSSIILVTPVTTEIISPNIGFSATITKL